MKPVNVTFNPISYAGGTYHSIVARPVMRCRIDKMIFHPQVLARKIPPPSNGFNHLQFPKEAVCDVERRKLWAEDLFQKVSNQECEGQK